MAGTIKCRERVVWGLHKEEVAIVSCGALK